MNIRVAVCGQKDIAIRCTSILLKKDVEVGFVTPNKSDTGKDGWQLSFRNWAKKNNLKIIESDHNLIKREITEHKIDLLFSIYYDKILKKDLINLIPQGVVNTHLSALPRYRGIAPITFAILNGEENHGVSLHYIDEGIDRGDIISQKFFSIKDLNANEAFRLATEECIQLFDESVDSILAGSNLRVQQDNSKALYYSNKSIDWGKSHIISDNTVFFNKDSRTIYNWMRAFIFPPLQYPRITIGNTSYEIHLAKPVYDFNSFEKPGSVILTQEIEDQFVQTKISTHDCYIVLKLKPISAIPNEK